MQSKSAVLLKVLLNTFHPGSPQSLLKILPEEDAKAVMASETSSKQPLLALTWPQYAITRTHYSWLAPVIEQLPKAMQIPLVASIPEPQSSGLRRLLKLAPFRAELPPSAKMLLLKRLYLLWQPTEGLPPDYLPTSPLESLLSCSKAELINVIDLLAMYDLAEGIRHIVDKKKLKLIYFCLTPQQQQFLRQCLHKHEKLVAPKIDIEKWDGNPEKLTKGLHRRGMLRLGKALCGQGRHFLWHIVHILDTGRGKEISLHYQNEALPGITSLLVQQVISVINFLKPKSDK